MWFFLQKNFKAKHRLLGILIAVSGIAHGGVCALCFLIGRVISSQRVVFAMKKNVRVSMRSGGIPLQEGISGAAVQPSVSQPTELNKEAPSSALVQETPLLKDEVPLIPKSLEQKVSQAKKDDKAGGAQKKVTAQKPQQPAKKKAVQQKKVQPSKKIAAPKPAPLTQPAAPEAPLSSALKNTEKKQSSLNVKESSQEAKSSLKDKAEQKREKKEDAPLSSSDKRKTVPPVSQQLPATSKTTSLNVKEASQVKESSQEVKSSLKNKGEQKEEVPLSSSDKRKTVPPVSQQLPAASKTTSIAQAASPTLSEKTGSSPSNLAQGGEPQVQEVVPFALEEGSLSDHEIVREIWCHYRKPPGFDEHEPFVFTFEIKHRKAISIGPRGKEPLIIYTALKDAVLKATFMHSNFVKRVELVIT